MAAVVINALKRKFERQQAREDAKEEEEARARVFSPGTSGDHGNKVAPVGDPNQAPAENSAATISTMDDNGSASAQPEGSGESKENERVTPITKKKRMTKFLAVQIKVYKWYNSPFIQICVAILILINFIVNAAEAQVLSEDNPIFKGFEMFFTVIFTIELVVNMFAHWPTMFWESGWNWFDFLVVSISLMSLLLEGLPGISTLRLMRAFRVFRLFKRLASLRKIIKALENAIPGCSNAFSIVILVNAIYSILGVEFFSDAEPGFFGTFASAMLTMFQVMTGDSWAQSIARPIIDVYPVASIFFVSYILVANIMLVNVVIAVLLEKMVDGGDEEEESDEPPPLPDYFLVDPDTDEEQEQEVTSDSEQRKNVYRATDFASQGTHNGHQESQDQLKSSHSRKSLTNDKHGELKGPAPPIPACGFHVLSCIVDRLEALQSELNEMKAELSSIELNNSQTT